jgi:hypothetical protein
MSRDLLSLFALNAVAVVSLSRQSAHSIYHRRSMSHVNGQGDSPATGPAVRPGQRLSGADRRRRSDGHDANAKFLVAGRRRCRGAGCRGRRDPPPGGDWPSRRASRRRAWCRSASPTGRRSLGRRRRYSPARGLPATGGRERWWLRRIEVVGGDLVARWVPVQVAVEAISPAKPRLLKSG